MGEASDVNHEKTTALAEEFFAQLAKHGTWWTSEQLITLVHEAREARNQPCQQCQELKAVCLMPSKRHHFVKIFLEKHERLWTESDPDADPLRATYLKPLGG